LAPLGTSVSAQWPAYWAPLARVIGSQPQSGLTDSSRALPPGTTRA
jgi:hypothetical protein